MINVIDKNGNLKTASTGGGGGAALWGDIFGIITDQTDLVSYVNGLGFITASSSDALTNKTGLISQWTNDSGYITSSGVTPAALTRVNDTNVTLTLGGTPTTALLQATSLTLGWTGTLADGRIASSTTWNNKVTSLTSGTGISIGGTTTVPIVTNTLPDQTVVLTNGTAISVTGTYPNFTITNTSPSSGGTVTLVSGTTNRITVATGTTTPVIDISSSYAGQGSIITLGTITTGVWNGTAIANGNLANSSVTIGSTAIALGATSTTLAGLTSVTSTTFVGALTGNATTATALATGRTISISGDITYTSPSFDGSGNVTAAGTLATVNSNVGSFGSATQVGTFTVNAKGLITAASNVSITGFVSSTLTDTHIFVGNGLNVATDVALSGDATLANTGTLTLATVNSNVGSFGSATQTATFTVNAKGLTTAAANVTITPAVGSITGLGTGVATALAINTGSAGAFVTFNGALGTPSSGTLTNCTFPTLNQNTTGSAASLSISGQTGLLTVTGLVSTNRIKTVRDAADTILELGGSYTPTGTWTSLTLVTPTLGVATATSINKVAITAPATSSTLTIADGSSLITAGAFAITLTSTATTNVTLPTSGTLVNTAVTTLSSLVSVGTITTGTWASTISNAATVTLKDTLFTLQDDGDTTKQLQFQLSGITTATTRTLTIPDASGTIALTTAITTTGSDLSWSAAGGLSVPDAGASARGVITTGSQTIAGAKSFSGNANFTSGFGSTTAGASVMAIGTSSFIFRTTNAGSNISMQTIFDVDNSASTAGAQAFGFETANGFVFTAANGTRRTARAALKLTSLTNTAASEAATLSFYTQNAGAAMAENMRLTNLGGLSLTGTNTTVGTTGNQTINKPTGTVNIAAAGTTVTVTNSLVSTSSIVFCVLRTNDSTARISNVVPGSGSFVINIVACTAEVSIGFLVINNF